MKTPFVLLSVLLIIFIGPKSNCQEFVSPLDFSQISTLFNSPCIVKLQSGEEVTGKFNGTMLSGSNYLGQIIVILDNGKWKKFKAEEINSFRVKTTKSAENFAIIPGRTIKVNGWTINLDEDKTVLGEYFIFELARLGKKEDKCRLFQLLNPGFDHKIKVLFYSNNEGGGMGTGIGADFTYTKAGNLEFIFVKDEKSYMVRPNNYKEISNSLYSDCPKMLEVFNNEFKWSDLVNHIMVYDQLCK